MTRNKVLKFGVLTVMAVIVGRLFFIQILQHEMWTEKAAAQQTLTNTLPAERGEIYMMDESEPTAVVLNATVYTVIVDPMLADQEAVAEVVGKAVGDKLVAEWDEVFANRNLRYYVVARGVERAAAEQIAEAELTGVWLQSDTERVYPEGTLASTVLGFVNAEGEGQYARLLGDALGREDYVLAVRLRFAAVLRLLDERGIVRRGAGKTNRDYFYEIGDEARRRAFGRLCWVFDRVAYGEFPFGAEAYRQVEREFDDFEKEAGR